MRHQDLLSIYLNTHLTGANAGVEMFRRSSEALRSTDVGAELDRVRQDVEEDRETLRALMARLGVSRNKPMAALGLVAERVGRLTPTGLAARRSSLPDLLELEALRGAVQAKKHGWEVLRAIAAHDHRITREEAETLIERAEDQAGRLGKLHLRRTQHVLEAAD